MIVSRREAAVLRRVQITTIAFYTPNLNLVRQRIAPGFNLLRLLSAQSNEESEFRKVRSGYKAKLNLDPFRLKEREARDRHENATEWDPRLTKTVRNTLEKFALSPEQIEVSPLGYSEERLLTLARLVEGFSGELSTMDRSKLLSVMLLKFLSVKLDTNRLKLAIQTIINSGLDPSKMLAKQPTLVHLDLAQFTENARSLIDIVMGGGVAWEELKFNWVVKHELEMLSDYAARDEQVEICDEADLIERMYHTGDDGRLNESYIYQRIFHSIKKTVRGSKQTDTAVYKVCEKVFSRLRRAVITELCLKHFEEVVMGMSPEFLDDIAKHKSIGLKKSIWVDRFLSRVSSTKILINSEQTEEDMLSKVSLLKEYGIDLNKKNIITKCPQLLNVESGDVQKSIEILQLSPFNLNKNDISKTLSRDPIVFTVPDVLESTRQQTLQIPILRNFSWYKLVKDKPRVLMMNIAKVFDVLENHGFSDEEALTVLTHYQKFFGQINSRVKELEKNLKPIITVVGFSQRINIIRKRIAGVTAREKRSSYKDKASSPPESEETRLKLEAYMEEMCDSDLDD